MLDEYKFRSFLWCIYLLKYKCFDQNIHIRKFHPTEFMMCRLCLSKPPVYNYILQEMKENTIKTINNVTSLFKQIYDMMILCRGLK